MISVDGKGTVFPAKRGIVWIKILRKEFYKRFNEFNSDKSLD